MEGSLAGSTVHGIFQARILEWAAISFSREAFPKSICYYFIMVMIGRATRVRMRGNLGIGDAGRSKT